MTQDSDDDSARIAEYEKRRHECRQLRWQLADADLDLALDPAESVAYLEKADLENPASVDERCTQLYHIGFLSRVKRQPDFLPARIKHVCWFIENDTEHPILASADCYSFHSEDKVSDIEQAWLRRLKLQYSPIVNYHASLFFSKRFPVRSVSLISQAASSPLPTISNQQMFVVTHQIRREGPTWLVRTKAKRAMRLVEANLSPKAYQTYKERNWSFLLMYFMCAALMTYLYFSTLQTNAPRGFYIFIIYLAGVFYFFSLEYFIRIWAFSFFDLLPRQLSTREGLRLIRKFGPLALFAICVATSILAGP